MHNPALAALRLDWRYLAFPVAPETLQEALRGAMRMRFLGLNLTVPHKLLAVPMMDVLDETARTWGAVNTVLFEGRLSGGEWRPLREFPAEAPLELRMRGFNTDADAIPRSLREDLGWQPEGSEVLLLGAGGAGRVGALRLAAEGVRRLHLVNRTLSKAEDLAREITARYPSTEVTVGYPGPSVELDLVINASSAGLKSEDPLPGDLGQLRLERVRRAYDMIYRPRETRFLAAAKAAGCRTANGLGMLLYQGAAALEIWSGRPAPLAVMKEALHQAIYV